MRPIFTIHAGEYLVASYIEQNFKNLNVWIPTKDTGVDLLLTNSDNKKSVSLQVKFSKDFLITHMDDIFQKGLKTCGWWTLNRSKIKKSKADYWVFALHRFNAKQLEFLIIKPTELLDLFKKLKRNENIIQSYIWISEKNKAWEARGLSKTNQILIANNSFSDANRNLTTYLNNWKVILDKLK